MDNLNWNGWQVIRIFNWYCARKGEKTIWFHRTEAPRGWFNTEYHLINFLNKRLP